MGESPVMVWSVTALLALVPLRSAAGVGTGPDPAGMIVARDCDGSGELLLTTGTDRGLAVHRAGSGGLYVVSGLPGAGRNGFFAGGDVVFKECPEGGAQRIVMLAGGCDSSVVLLRGDRVGGPFRASDGVLASHGESIVRLALSDGRELQRWRAGFFSPSVCECGGFLYAIDGNGRVARIDAGTEEIFVLPGIGPAATLSTSPDGSAILVRMTDGGITVLRPGGEPIGSATRRTAMYPRWTPGSRVLFCRADAGGSGLYEIVEMDPSSGATWIVESGLAAPAHPIALPDGGSILYTDAVDGDLMLAGAGWPEAVRLPERWTEDLTSPRRSGLDGDDPAACMDVAWMHQRWDTPDWFDGSWSCGPTSCTMALQYYARLTADSIWCSSPAPGHWSRWGNYVPELFTFLGHTYDVWGISPGGVWVQGAHGFICRELGGAYWSYMTQFLEQCGLYSQWEGTAWSTLTGEIDNGWPMVCSSTIYYGGGTYGHIILFCGYYEDHTVVVNDPYGDANYTGWGQSYMYPNGKACLYDWPGYNNGHLEIGAVSQLFTARSDVLAEPDTLVDDLSHGFDRCGPCQYWHEASDAFDGHAWWTWSTAAPPDTCFAKWRPHLPATGSYEVLAWVPGECADATGIYRISTMTGPCEVFLDQSAYSSEWASLGVFPLVPGDSVYLGDYTGAGGQELAFDALRFHPVPGSSEEGPPATPAMLVPVPNPVSRGGSFSLEAPPGCRIEVYDLAGRLVLSVRTGNLRSASGSILIGHSIPEGVYRVRAVDESTGASLGPSAGLVVLDN